MLLVYLVSPYVCLIGAGHIFQADEIWGTCFIWTVSAASESNRAQASYSTPKRQYSKAVQSSLVISNRGCWDQIVLKLNKPPPGICVQGRQKILPTPGSTDRSCNLIEMASNLINSDGLQPMTLKPFTAPNLEGGQEGIAQRVQTAACMWGQLLVQQRDLLLPFFGTPYSRFILETSIKIHLS